MNQDCFFLFFINPLEIHLTTENFNLTITKTDFLLFCVIVFGRIPQSQHVGRRTVTLHGAPSQSPATGKDGVGESAIVCGVICVSIFWTISRILFRYPRLKLKTQVFIKDDRYAHCFFSSYARDLEVHWGFRKRTRLEQRKGGTKLLCYAAWNHLLADLLHNGTNNFMDKNSYIL